MRESQLANWAAGKIRLCYRAAAVTRRDARQLQ